MKVCVMASAFPTLSETFVLDHITGLIDRGHSVGVVANDDAGEELQQSSVGEYDLRQRTQYTKPPRTRQRQLLDAAKILLTRGPEHPTVFGRILADAAHDPKTVAARTFRVVPFLDGDWDVVHSHFGPVGNKAAALKQYGAFDAPLLTSFHGWGVRRGRQEGGDIYAELFETAELLLANSRETRESLVAFGAPPEKVRVHHVGIDLSRFEYREPEPPDDEVTLLSVGRLVEEKGHADGIRAVHRLVEDDLDVEYRIVGDGSLADDLRDLIERLGIENAVTLCGAKRHEDVRAEMRDADVFFLPSRSEGLGRVLLEAQAIGLPIVATNAGGVSEGVVPGESARLAPAGDVPALASAVREIVDDPEVWGEMAATGRRHVEREFDLEDLNDELVTLYASLT